MAAKSFAEVCAWANELGVDRLVRLAERRGIGPSGEGGLKAESSMARRRREDYFIDPSEDALQTVVLEHWKMLGVAGSLVAAIPNKKARGQARLTPGLRDLKVLMPLLGSTTGFIELKTTRGRLSADPRTIGNLMMGCCLPYAVTIWARRTNPHSRAGGGARE
jgi:hypothetical protein